MNQKHQFTTELEYSSIDPDECKDEANILAFTIASLLRLTTNPALMKATTTK